MRVALLVVLGACVDAVSTPPKLDAQQQFAQRAWPALAVCNGCHGAQPTIDFLAPGTADGAYASLFAFQPPVVDLDAPAASLLVTMGKHTGPALEQAAADDVLSWIELERAERVTPAPTIAVGPIDLTLGTPASLALPTGGTVTFTPSAVSGGLYLSQLAITAPATGLHVVHPLFVVHPAKLPAVVDTLDRFADVDVKLAAGERFDLGGGDALFLDFDPTLPLSIHFRKLEAP